MDRRIFKCALVDTVPIMMGYLTMGFAAGVLMGVQSGTPCPALWAGLCGFAFVSGTLSFAIVPAIAGGYSLGAVALLTLGINFRYALYGFALVGRWKPLSFWRKLFLVHSLADEIYALDVACPLPESKRNRYSFYNHLLCTAYWVVGTTAGGAAGAALPIPSKGIEFAMCALFIVIFTEQIRKLGRK